MALRILLLVRLVAFIGVLYLALHILVARMSTKPGSRLLWFFEVLTGPLTRAVARVAGPETPPARLRWWALAAIGAIWVAAIVAVESLAARR